MRTDIYFESCGTGNIRAGVWTPPGEPVAVVQILHGIAEHIERYENFARYLNQHGILVVAADHMGHGKSIGTDGIRGYFHGGWFSAVEDAYQLLTETKKQYPELPYILFGHSMGSFMARTILSRHPDSGIDGAIICGTGWQSKALLKVAIPMCNYICKKDGEKNPSPTLQKIMFGNYNNKVEHVRTANDWLTRDSRIVDAYNADPLCGFAATAGLYRDMLTGIRYIQQEQALQDGRFLYTVMEVIYKPSSLLTPAQCYFPPTLIKNDYYSAYYKWVIKGLETIVLNRKDLADPFEKEALEDLRKKEMP